MIELLSPAGNLVKLKTAIDYGADAVYVGGKAFSLRARANNFTLDDLKEGAEYCHSHGKKIYVTMNIVARSRDYIDSNLKEYLDFLSKINVDACICSSMYIAKYIIKNYPSIEVHLSTQASSINSEAIKFYTSLGIKRVVLGREASIDEIKSISKNTDIELEVFIHGGMCSSVSGRCMLSNYFVNRDANRGGCAHSCRWNYDLYNTSGKKLNHRYYVNMAAKDLCAIDFIKDLMDAKVASLKIEGRMKSEYYIATVVRCYRMLIDALQRNEEVDLNFFKEEMAKAENRLSSHGFLNGPVTKNEQLFDSCDHPTKEFIGYVLDYDKEKKLIKLEQRNYFKLGDTVEFFGPNIKNIEYKVSKMYNERFEEITVAPHPLEIIYLPSDVALSKGDMIRLKH